jgi:hypothetical protein
VHQILKIIESFFSLVIISFFLGIFWFLACNSQNYLLEEFNGPGELDFFSQTDHVIDSERVQMLTYFLTTTLSTVGLGDLKPISNFERIIGSILMLGG